MTISSITPFNKTGSRLVSKLRKNLTEVIKIETNFGKGSTTVTTTYDTDNSPLKRIIEKRVLKKPTEKTVITYDGVYSVRRKTVIEKFINKRRVQKIVKSEVKQIDQGQNFLTRIVSIFTPLKDKSRLETQVIEELSTKKYRRYIKTTAIKLPNGTLVDKTIDGNVKYLKKFAKSPYFYFRGYSPKEFLLSIIPYAKKLQKVSKRDIHILFDSLSKEVGANSHSNDGIGYVAVDMSKTSGLSNIVNIINHEFRHQYQDKIIEKYEAGGIIGTLRRIFNPFQYQYAQKCKTNLENYVSVSKDKDKYMKQFIEIDARLAGYKAKDEYQKETGLLIKLFTHCKELFTGNEEIFRLLTPYKKTVNTKFTIK